MKSFIFGIIIASFVFSGCGKRNTEPKQVVRVESDSLSLDGADTLLASPTEQAANQERVSDIIVNQEAEPLVGTPAVFLPDTPDPQSIQKALKNLGLYQGEVDGKVGPKTKEAIREFQKKNSLEADGKAGPKTWAILKRALEQPAGAQSN